MVDDIAHHNNINHSSDKPQIAMVDDIAHRGVVYVVMVGYVVYHCYLRFVRGVIYVVMVGYVFYHCYLRFVRGVIDVVMVGYIVT
jgi:hypothetical protein